MSKSALITGITGQDGSYLAEYLLSKGYEVHGIIRRASTFNTARIDRIYTDPHEKDVRLHLHYGDLSEAETVNNIIFNIRPDEVYNLAAQSHVRVSFDVPEYTTNVVATGVTRMLESIRRAGNEVRFYQASSSEMFGSTAPPQSEARRSPPLAVRMLQAVRLLAHAQHREGYGLYACNGILSTTNRPGGRDLRYQERSPGHRRNRRRSRTRCTSVTSRQGGIGATLLSTSPPCTACSREEGR